MSHEKFQACIDACYHCATECKHCAGECLAAEDVKSLMRCIKLNSDCATVCVMAAKMMAGDSEFSLEVCELCADICDACASECEKNSHHEFCRKCAEACRKCALACREMSNVPIE